jgi:stress response protein YsnF
VKVDPHYLGGTTVYDREGAKLGKVKDLLLDEQTREPEWLLVDTGSFGRDTLIPFSTAEQGEDGIVVPYTQAQVKDAPHAGSSEGLTVDEERDLYGHYGLGQQDGSETELQGPEEQSPSAEQGELPGRDESAPIGERPAADEQHGQGVRIRRRIVTEHVQITVPVEREEIVVEGEPGEHDASEHDARARMGEPVDQDQVDVDDEGRRHAA